MTENFHHLDRQDKMLLKQYNLMQSQHKLITDYLISGFS